jgi:hypothetical protein
VDEGITACQWRPLAEALEILSYDNARGVLKRAGEMVRTLVAVGAGRPEGRGGTTERRNEGTIELLNPAAVEEDVAEAEPFRRSAD